MTADQMADRVESSTLLSPEDFGEIAKLLREGAKAKRAVEKAKRLQRWDANAQGSMERYPDGEYVSREDLMAALGDA